MSLDHIVPRSQGGTRSPENVVPACRKCNQEKDNKSVEEYRAELQRRRGVQVIFAGELAVLATLFFQCIRQRHNSLN